MSDKPILFSAPMVLAILREIKQPGTGKTQTRRVLTGNCDEPPALVHDGQISARDDGDREYRWPRTKAVGDRLYVREAWHAARSLDSTPPRDIPRDADIEHAATSRNYAEIGLKGKLRPAMFLPRWASRITLIVTDVRVQRVQEITEADAVAEGLTPDPVSGRYLCGMDEVGPITAKSPITAFAWLWNGINGKRPGCHWQDNPWIAAYTFRPILGNIDALAREEAAAL